MKMQEFVEKYCSDIKTTFAATPTILDDYDLPYDDEIEDESGQQMKVVYCGKYTIPIMDILTSTREDFAQLYPDFGCRELYDRYLESLIMFEGEDAISHIRSVMQREQERIHSFNADISLADML